MAKTQEDKKDIVSSVRLVARKCACLRGTPHGQRAGPAVVAAGLAKVLGVSGAGVLLCQHGISDVKAFLAAIPDCTEEEATEFPELKPNEDLQRLLKAGLQEFFQGRMSADAALRILLDAPTPEVKEFLSNPRVLMKLGSEADTVRGTKDLLRALARYYQVRFHVGYTYHTVDPDSGTSDFLTGKEDKAFLKAVSELYREERAANEVVFSSPLYRDSPLGKCGSEYGQLGAHVLAISLLSEMGLVSHGPLSVRQIAWTLDGKNFHRMLGYILEKTGELRSAGLVEIIPDGKHARLCSVVLASQGILNEFLSYLRDADPLTTEDQADILQRAF